MTAEYLVDKNLPYAQVLEELVNDSAIASYVYGLDLISQERGNADSYYLVDGLGSTRGLTDASGVVTDTYTYDAFGNLIASGGNIENDYLFAGEQFDEDLGQYYLRDRYYNPSVGRFTRVDTYQGRRSDPMSRHDYLYTHANPVNYIDPSGLYTTTMDLNGLMAGIGALSAIASVSWVVPTLKFATAISLAGFLAYYGIYVPYFAADKGRKGKQGQPENPDDSEDSVAGAGSPDPGGEDPKNKKPEGEKSSQEEVKLTKKGREKIKNLEHLKDETVSQAIRQRGGGAGQVNQVDTSYQKMKVSEVANRAAQGDSLAETALKMIK